MGKQDLRAPKAATIVKDPDFRLPAVDRALSLFELLANSQRGLTLSEVSRKLDIPKSTAHYLVHTLMTRGYVERGADRQLLLGIRFAEVAGSSSAEVKLRTLVTPYLRQVTGRIHLTATATVLRGVEAVVIAKVRSFQDNRGGAWIGAHVDLHCTAQGKALLSTLSDEELDELYGRRELGRCTPKTISSLGALKAHLAQVRENGFAVNDEEHVPDLRAVAAPIVNSAAGYVMSVSVRGSLNEMPLCRIPQYGREMILVSREISHRLSAEL